METNLNDLLLWMVSPDGGAFIVVSAAISIVAEQWDVWHNLSKTVKAVVMIVLSTLLGWGAYLLLQHPDIVAALDPLFKIFAYTALAYTTNQGMHAMDKLLKRAGKVEG